MLLSPYTNDRNGEQCFQENVCLFDSEKQVRGPARRELLAAVLPLKPSGFVFVHNGKREEENEFTAACGRAQRGDCEVHGHCHFSFPCSLGKSPVAAMGTCSVLAQLSLVPVLCLQTSVPAPHLPEAFTQCNYSSWERMWWMGEPWGRAE